MRILNYSLNNYKSQVDNFGRLVMIPMTSMVTEQVMFTTDTNKAPIIQSSEDFLDNTWIGSTNGVTAIITKKCDDHLVTGYNILQTAIFADDNRTIIDEVNLLMTADELQATQILACGNYGISQLYGNCVCQAWLLVPKTARYTIGDRIYSCNTGKELSKNTKKGSRRHFSPVIFISKRLQNI